MDGNTSLGFGDRQPSFFFCSVNERGKGAAHRLNGGGQRHLCFCLRYSRPLGETQAHAEDLDRNLSVESRAGSNTFICVAWNKRRNGYHFYGGQQARKLPNAKTNDEAAKRNRRPKCLVYLGLSMGDI